MRPLLILAASVALAASGIDNPQTVAFCDLLNNPQAFEGKLIRVRALYLTDFEKAVLTAPACAVPRPVTWVSFEKSWESRTSWRLRHAMNGIKWNVESDVVLVGTFKTGGPFGHLDVYPFLFEVYRVEAVKPSGSFRPLPVRRSTPPPISYRKV